MGAANRLAQNKIRIGKLWISNLSPEKLTVQNNGTSSHEPGRFIYNFSSVSVCVYTTGTVLNASFHTYNPLITILWGYVIILSLKM